MSLEGDSGHSLNGRIHFTYKENPDRESLCQGDVLAITEGLSRVLREVHPYFLNKQYKYFMVLTQSCDLVRRDGKTCKTPYITVAAVRSYQDFLKRELIRNRMAEEYKGQLLMDEKNRARAYQFVERIYNNTESDYFFLYKEESLGLQQSMIVSLKVSIALKSSEHYETCLQAKQIELADEFKAKLGWLVGNMYSRVGTTDWGSVMSQAERKNMINNDLAATCICGSKEQLKDLKKIIFEQGESIIVHERMEELLSEIPVKSKYDKLMDTIADTVDNFSSKMPKEEKEKLMKALRSRQVIKDLVK